MFVKLRASNSVLVIGILITCSSISVTKADSKSSEQQVETEVRKVFDAWGAALTQGDKKTYLDTFWDSPRLVIRVAQGEWHGLDVYRKRIEGATLPPGNPADYRNVEVIALGNDGAVVTYERPAPSMGTGGPSAAVGSNADSTGSIVFRGTVVFKKTADGWKIVAWQADSVTRK